MRPCLKASVVAAGKLDSNLDEEVILQDSENYVSL